MNINDETEETSRQSVPQEVEGRETGVFAAMETQRAVRRFRPESVPREVLESMVFYATRAPSGGNRQPWEFLVITDSKVIKSLAAIYEEASRPVFASSLAQATNEQAKRVYQDALYLTDHLDEAPAIILVCVSVPSGRTFEQQLPSVYPAIQNLLLAARAYGLGSVLTAVHRRRDQDVRLLLSIPAGVETVALIPVGYPRNPDRAFRPSLSRRPVEEVLHWQKF